MTTPGIDTVANPYVGPRTFDYADRQRFFGREAEAAGLLARVISERLLLFYAQSGAGKSSLINARLIPQLREVEGFSVLPVGRVAGQLPAGVERVDNIYLFNLMSSLDQGEGSPAAWTQLSLSEFLEHLVTADGVAWRYDPGAVPAGEESADTEDRGSASRFALVVDQFEEIITGHPDRWREREGFFRQLDAALQAHPNLWIVLTLREDYLAALDPYAPLVFNRLRARFYMERMGVDAALEAVAKPAALAGRPFAEGVAEQLVENLRQVRVPGQEDTVPGQYVEPVQLQVVCYQLWENIKDRPPGQITLADLQEAGDVDRALTQFFEVTLAVALADPAAAGVSERQLRTWFDTELITEAGTRGLVHQGVDDTGGLPNGVVRALQKRFLVRAEARGGDTWIELVHDRFVEPIRASNAAWFPQHLSALQRQAALWDAEGRKSGLLLQGEALVEAEAWAKDNEAELEPRELDFLEACREARDDAERERRQSRRIRVLALVAGAVAVLALVAAAVAVMFYLRAETAQQKEAIARQNADNRTEIAQTLLAVQRDFLAQLEDRRLTVTMLQNQRQWLEQGESVLASGVVPQKAKVPYLTGKNYADAQQLLNQVCEPQPCLRSQVQWETTDAQASSLVLRSEPSAGAELLWGSAVTVTLSQGEPMAIEQPIEMELVPIPAGVFLMGTDAWAGFAADDEYPQHLVDIPEFYIGKYEVTNAQYAAFVEDTGRDAPDHWEADRVPSGKEDYPVVYVSWDDAVAFTEWLGEENETRMAFRLCTEAEWEKACRGTDGLTYPWGDTFDVDKANTVGSGIDDTTPVGSYSPAGDSPYGVADMIGNVWEWVGDWHDEGYYENSPTENPQGPEGGAYRVLRGGGFDTDGRPLARCGYRGAGNPVFESDSTAFRVCVSPGRSTTGLRPSETP